MKYEHPVIVEMNLQDILRTVKDEDKLRLIEAMVSTIMEEGIIGEIRNLVCSPSYDD